MMKYREIDSNSNKAIINAIQCYEVLKQAEESLHHYRGNVTWQTINGKEYLISRLNARQNKSLGVKSPATEAIYESGLSGGFQTYKFIGNCLIFCSNHHKTALLCFNSASAKSNAADSVKTSQRCNRAFNCRCEVTLKCHFSNAA